MCVRGKARLVSVLLLLLVCGCADSQSRVNEVTGVSVNPKSSGYKPGVRQWSEFLQCWKAAEEQGALLPQRDRSYSVLDRGRIRDTATSEASIAAAIEAAEKALGTALPASYKDFLQAYSPDEKGPATPDLKVSVGLFDVREVTRMKTFDPEVLKLAEKYPLEATDVEYFVYGVGQDQFNGRTGYRADAIVIGKYGPALFERIVLYPQVRTSDGEVEAALHHHAGEFRAPSFAELMRQLSFLEINDAVDMPPYPQATLRNTCAQRLPLINVWWP